MNFFKSAFLLFFIILSASAQNSENDFLQNKNSYITASLFPIVDLYAPRLRLGYVQHLAPHWKLGLDLGLGSKGLAFATTDTNAGIEYFLWEVRPELHYIFNPEAKTLKYLSTELFYIQQDHVFVNDEYRSGNSEELRYDRADFSRQKYGMHFKLGIFLNIGKHAGFNFFGGLGFRLANKQYTNIVNAQEVFETARVFNGPYDVEGKTFGLNTSLGIKFYYKI
jgi:hypothetical protein